MKKMLSLILCLATIFSSVAFCFPAIAADIEFGVETGKEQATLPAGTEDAALADDLSLPVIYDFEDGKVPDAFNLTNQNAKVAVSVVDKGEGKVLQIALAAQTMWLAGRVNFDITTGTLPAGLYRISVDFAAEEYPDSGLEFYIYSRTKTGGKLVSTKLTGENGLAVTEDRTVTVELEATEDLDTSTIQFAVKKPVTSEPLTYTLDNFKFEEIPVPVTVRFDGNGADGSQESISTTTGETVTLPAETTFTRDYYDFKGWSRNKDAAFKDAVSSYTVDKADLDSKKTVTFYALWERRTFDVNFDFAGGLSSLPTKYTINEGEVQTINLPTPSEVKRSKYLLNGWTDAAGKEYKCGESVTLSEANTFTAVWLDISAFTTVTASKASGYDGKTQNVDLRFPGAYYTLPVALDPETVSVDALNISKAASVEYDAKNNVLIVYPSASTVRPGATISYEYTQTTIVTADGKSLLALPAVSYTLASSFAGIYDNLIPYGDAEGTYFPYFTSHGSAKAKRLEDADGNHYAHLAATATGDACPHLGVNFYFENGATYKFTGRYRRATGGDINMNVSFSASENMTYCVPDLLSLHPNKWNHNHGIGDSTTWKDVYYEFTVNKTGGASDEVTIYSNPSGGKITEFDVDDFAVYKRIDVTYSEGVSAKLADGKTAPATTGAYLDGSGSTVKLAEECPYEPLESGWWIDEEKPWLDQYGKTYALGEEIDLAENGPLTLVPNLATSVDTYTIIFACDDLATAIPPVKVAVGETLDLSKVEDIIPADSTKNFNGWSLRASDDWRDALLGEFKPTKDTTTLYPIISYNFNMAIANNRSRWVASNSEFRSELYKGASIVLDQAGKDSADVIITATGHSVPARLYKGVNLIVDNNYKAEGAIEFTVGKTIEGLYFGRTGEGAAGSRLIPGETTVIDDDGLATIYMNGCAHKDWNGTITYTRFDPMQTKNVSMAIRAVEFVPAEPLEDGTEISITGLTAPVTGELAGDTATDANGIATVSSVSWSPALINGRFDEATVYTATLTLVPAAGLGKIFTPNVKVTLGGESCDVAYDATTGVLTATREFDVTEEYIRFNFSIVGPDSILKADRPIQYTTSIDAESPLPDTSASWSIESGEIVDGAFKVIADAEYATITENGKVVPSADGIVRITATSNYNLSVKATLLVQITNQAEKGSITYHAGTTDTVTGLPDVQEGYGTTALSEVIPTRADSSYTFLGWAASDESADLITSVMVPSGTNIDVYAVWGKGVKWTFGNKGDHKLSSNVVARGDDYDEIKPTVGDYRIHMTNLNLDAQEYSTVIIRMSSVSPASTKIFYKTKFINDQGEEVIMGYDTNGFGYAEAQSFNKFVTYDGLDNFKNVSFDFKNDDTCNTAGKWRTAKEVVSIYVDPCKTSGQNFRISYVQLLAAPTVTFNANTTDTVTGMPEATKIAMGSKYTISEKPVREGYTFLGWAKSADDRSDVKTTFGIVGDITLYAVWDKTVDTNPTEDGSVNKYPVTGIEASHTAILVKVGTEKGVKVEFVYTGANGEQNITATTNANGYAVIDLSDIARPINDAYIALPKEKKATSILLTDIDSATATANKVVDNSGNKNNTNKGGTGSGGYKYDNTVSDVKNDGTQYEVGGITSGGDTKTVLSESKAEGTILFNFDEEYEKDFFKDLRQMSLVGMNSSVLSYNSLGKKAGSSDSPALFTGTLAIDAATHKYIVVKAKHSGLSNNNFRIYFHNDGSGFSEANAETQKLTDGDYSMLVYDMGAKEGWKDTITALFFSLDGDVKGTVDIDWIMFTDTVPASMDDVTGAKVNFPVVNKDAMPFTDVTASDWFYSEVANAYKLGFVEGTSAANYEPSGSVTIAEAITLAVRLNYIYNEKTLPKAATEGEWFKPFVDAAVRAGIIKTNQFAEYDVPALRKQVAAIMAKALPNEFYKKMNMFIEVPDLDKKDSAYSAVLKLYNAGIVIGSDEKYNFLPESNITRAEIAAIVNRIAEPANRKRVVTEAEIESKKKRYYADDIAAAVSLGNCTAEKMTVKDGVAWATGKSNDPIVYLTDLVGELNGKEITQITFGLKWDSSKVTPAPGVFFVTPSGGWAAERFIKANKGTEHENGVVDYIVSANGNAQFANTIKQIRFDPFDAAQEFGIAYIIIE